jgi:hypothetical protein
MTIRIAEKSRIEVVGPAAPVRKDAAIVVDVADENVSCRRRHDKLHLAVPIRDPRHAGRDAFIRRGRALSAGPGP